MGRRRLSERERMMKSIEKQMNREFHGYRWEWRGAWFISYFHGKIGELWFLARFEIDLQKIRVTILSEERYGEPDESETFCKEQDGALGDCMKWTAEKLIALYEKVSVRIAPFAQSHSKYHLALKGSL